MGAKAKWHEYKSVFYDDEACEGWKDHLLSICSIVSFSRWQDEGRLCYTVIMSFFPPKTLEEVWDLVCPLGGRSPLPYDGFLEDEVFHNEEEKK